MKHDAGQILKSRRCIGQVGPEIDHRPVADAGQQLPSLELLKFQGSP